ncbi:hypothetical protein [Streptomyces sp. SID12488]|uniref:hypothetical protein n=1 Tax=Streptomyces sp. SID12488 TaxID=2706040 RepID=UPI0013DBF206|nr:hypothetical protein [Streptomyces sp. SID12488]NEA63967.1 hypothetical protein [Streptomyces sp. SID12488]
MFAFTLRPTLASAAALVVLTAGVTLAGGTVVARAGTVDCVKGANGFHDHPDDASGDTAKPRTVQLGDGVVLTLEKGVWDDTQIGFGKISGTTHPGDNLWMDWKARIGEPNAQSPWLQCGPFTVGTAKQSLTTPFRRTSNDSAYQFRVCGSLKSNGVVQCSTWW